MLPPLVSSIILELNPYILYNTVGKKETVKNDKWLFYWATVSKLIKKIELRLDILKFKLSQFMDRFVCSNI